MRTRAILAGVGLAGALVAAGCGPDCELYCVRLATCAAAATPPVALDPRRCADECEQVGGEKASTVACVASHSCADLAAGHCSPTGEPKSP